MMQSGTGTPVKNFRTKDETENQTVHSSETLLTESRNASLPGHTEEGGQGQQSASSLPRNIRSDDELPASHAGPPPPGEAPIELTDAVGRQYKFPWRVAKTWKGMTSLITEAFRAVEGLEGYVQRECYDLAGPDGSIILPSVWDDMIQPGSQVKMLLWPQDGTSAKANPPTTPLPEPGAQVMDDLVLPQIPPLPPGVSSVPSAQGLKNRTKDKSQARPGMQSAIPEPPPYDPFAGLGLGNPVPIKPRPRDTLKRDLLKDKKLRPPDWRNHDLGTLLEKDARNRKSSVSDSSVSESLSAYIDLSDDELDGNMSDDGPYYRFNAVEPPLQKRSTLNLESEGPSNLELGDLTPRSRPTGGANEQTHCIIDTCNTLRIDGKSGHIIGKVDLRTYPASAIESDSALYYMKHFQMERLNFKEFKNNVLSLDCLRNVREGLQQHFQQHWSEHDKETVYGYAGARVPAFCRSTQNLRNNFVSLCMPFVVLGKHRYRGGAQNATGHISQKVKSAIKYLNLSKALSRDREIQGRLAGLENVQGLQTLYQSFSPGSNSRRDLKQAICHLEQRDDYLHVSYLWAVVVNDELLITCSTISEDQTFKKLRDLSPELPRHDVFESTGVHDLRINIDEFGTLLIKRNECSSWADLISKLRRSNSRISLDQCQDLLATTRWRDCKIQPWQWTEFISSKRMGALDVRLSMKDMLSPTAYATASDEEGFLKACMNMRLLRPLGHSAAQSSDDEADRLRQTVAYSEEHARHLRTLQQIEARLINPASRIPPCFSPAPEAIESPEITSEDKVSTGFPKEILLTANKGKSFMSEEEFNTSIKQWRSKVTMTTRNKETWKREGFWEDRTGFDISSPDGTSWDRESLEDSDIDHHDVDASTSDIDHAETAMWYYGNITRSFSYLLDFALAGHGIKSPSGDQLSAVLRSNLHGCIKALHSSMFPRAKVWTGYILFKTSASLDNTLHMLCSIKLHGMGFEELKISVGEIDYRDMMSTISKALLKTTETINTFERLFSSPVSPASSSTIGDTILEQRVAVCKARGDPESDAIRAKDEFRQLIEKQIELPRDDGRPPKSTSIKRAKKHWISVSHHDSEIGEMLRGAVGKTIETKATPKEPFELAVLPNAVLAIAARNVTSVSFRDHGSPVSMYRRYVQELEIDVMTGEPTREHSERLRVLRFELNAISHVLTQQLEGLDQFQDLCASSSKYAKKANILSRYSPERPDEMVLAEAVRSVSRDTELLHRLGEAVDELRADSVAALESVDDWRQNATVVFTIVTIIFLPLSVVASILGMNTADIRNTNINQWVFWSSALPLTALVIAVTLCFVDVPPLWRFLKRLKED